jgi:hypothetical protein
LTAGTFLCISSIVLLALALQQQVARQQQELLRVVTLSTKKVGWINILAAT